MRLLIIACVFSFGVAAMHAPTPLPVKVIVAVAVMIVITANTREL